MNPSLTNYPNGLTSFGVPVMGGATVPTTTGNYWFVSSLTGASANSGKSPAQPFATLAQAVSAATASNGDIIILMPGHAESLTASAAVTIDKAGLYIIGLGQGATRATFTWSTSTAAQMIISGAQTVINNVVMNFAGIDAVVAAISVTAVDFQLYNSKIITNSGTAGCVLGILTAATASRMIIENCFFVGPATNTGTTTTAQVKHEVGIDYVIRGNIFMGKCTQNILNATTLLGGLIGDNRFVTYTGTKCIAMAAASTPFITNNRINVPSGTAPIVAAAGFVAGNVYSAAPGITAGTASTF